MNRLSLDENIIYNIDDHLIGSEPSDSDIELMDDEGGGCDSDENGFASEHGEAGMHGEAGIHGDFAGGGKHSRASGFASAMHAGGGVTYKKLSYNDVRTHINKSYDQDIIHRYSSALDILASYVKGQKTIYMETRTHIVTLLNILMFPALFISGLITVLQGTLQPFVLAGLSALVTFLLAIINYCKLEGAAEAHKTSAYQYDKLQSFIEFQSGQVLLFSNPILNNENLTRFCEKERKIVSGVLSGDGTHSGTGLPSGSGGGVNDIYKARLDAENELIQNMRSHMVRIESDISDIKETNQFIIPQKIRYNYPLLYNTNVFSIIKKIDDYKAKTLTELKNIKNELRYISAYMKKYANFEGEEGTESAQINKYKKRSNELYEKKKNTINIILFLNTAFSMIDKMFQQEILNAKLRSDNLIRFFLYDLLRCCCIDKIKVILPPKYIEPEVSGGDVFSSIMGFVVVTQP